MCLCFKLDWIYDLLKNVLRRTWDGQQTCHGHLWTIGLHCEWGLKRVWFVKHIPINNIIILYLSTHKYTGYVCINISGSDLWFSVSLQPPPKLPLGVFTSDFQDFVTKWWAAFSELSKGNCYLICFTCKIYPTNWLLHCDTCISKHFMFCLLDAMQQ